MCSQWEKNIDVYFLEKEKKKLTTIYDPAFLRMSCEYIDIHT